MLLFDQAIMAIAKNLRDQQAATSCEHLYALAADGETYQAGGTATSVIATADLEERYDHADAGIVYHHSHPDERALSPSDLELITRVGVTTIWAHAPSGASYGARLKEGIDKQLYGHALSSLRGHLVLELIAYHGVSMTGELFEALRDFSVMRVLEEKGWIDCHMSWSDETRRLVFTQLADVYRLDTFLNSVCQQA